MKGSEDINCKFHLERLHRKVVELIKAKILGESEVKQIMKMMNREVDLLSNSKVYELSFCEIFLSLINSRKSFRNFSLQNASKKC